MNEEMILTVVALVLGVLSTVFAMAFVRAKDVVKELKDLIVELDISLEDGKVSKEELVIIVKEAKDVAGVFLKKKVD